MPSPGLLNFYLFLSLKKSHLSILLWNHSQPRSLYIFIFFFFLILYFFWRGCILFLNTFFSTFPVEEKELIVQLMSYLKSFPLILPEIICLSANSVWSPLPLELILLLRHKQDSPVQEFSLVSVFFLLFNTLLA